jgi:hypothetical protein
MTNGPQPAAHREPIKTGKWEVDECADPALQDLKGLNKRFRSAHLRALYGCRVIEAPMRD